MDLNEITFKFFAGFHLPAIKEQLDYRIETKDYMAVDTNNPPIFYYLPIKEGKFIRFNDGILVIRIVLFNPEAMINDKAPIQCKQCKWNTFQISPIGQEIEVPYTEAVYMYQEQFNRISKLFMNGYRAQDGVIPLAKVFSEAFKKSI